MERKNIIYADVLKILASIAVVMIHVCSMEWYTANPTGIKWNVLNIYSSLSRWAVPVFVMITGMFLLPPEKDITIQEIFTKYIKRIVILLVFWIVVYAFLGHLNSTKGITIRSIIDNIIDSYYHLWYLYMLIGLYLITPFVKAIINTKNINLIKYYIYLWIGIQCVFYTFVRMPSFSYYNAIYERMNFCFILGYVGYYILGYYLSENKLDKNSKICIYIIGIISALITICLARKLNISYGTVVAHEAYSSFSPFVFGMTVAVFVFIKELFSRIKVNDKINKIIKNIVKLSLGVYLIHPIFIIVMDKFNVDVLRGNTFIVIPAILVGVYISSSFIAYLISKIPLLNKYII